MKGRIGLDKFKNFRLLYWLVVILFVFLLVFLVGKLFPFYKTLFSFLWHLFAPFIIAIFIAYLLHPFVMKLHHYNLQKPLAIMLIYLLFFGGVAYLLYLGYPRVVHQIRDLNEQLPQLISMYENTIFKIYESTSFLPEAFHDKLDEFILRIENGLENILETLVGYIENLLDIIIIITVIPVLVFYFLKDYTKIKSFMKQLVPSKYTEQVSQIYYAIDESLGNYIRGQLIVSLFITLATWFIYSILNIDYALILAIIIGLTNIIPYFGPIIGTVPAVLITLSYSGKLVLFVIITTLVIQIIESNFLSPLIVGKSTKIHPITIIFVLLLGAKISGIIGMILAVPTYMIGKEIVIHSFAFKQSN